MTRGLWTKHKCYEKNKLTTNKDWYLDHLIIEAGEFYFISLSLLNVTVGILACKVYLLVFLRVICWLCRMKSVTFHQAKINDEIPNPHIILSLTHNRIVCLGISMPIRSRMCEFYPTNHLNTSSRFYFIPSSVYNFNSLSRLILNSSTDFAWVSRFDVSRTQSTNGAIYN